MRFDQAKEQARERSDQKQWLCGFVFATLVLMLPLRIDLQTPDGHWSVGVGEAYASEVNSGHAEGRGDGGVGSNPDRGGRTGGGGGSVGGVGGGNGQQGGEGKQGNSGSDGGSAGGGGGGHVGGGDNGGASVGGGNGSGVGQGDTSGGAQAAAGDEAVGNDAPDNAGSETENANDGGHEGDSDIRWWWRKT